MSVIRKISLKDALGTDTIYDIGAEAANVKYDTDSTVKDVLDDFDGHPEATVDTEDGVHGIRYLNNQLQLWDSTNKVWVNKIQLDNLTFYVDGAGGNDTNAGTQEAPFATITKAVSMIGNDSARAATAQIFVADGIYTENITIAGKNISISGINGGSANVTLNGAINASNFARVYLNKIKINLSSIPGVNAVVAGNNAFVISSGGIEITGDGSNTGFYAHSNGVIHVAQSKFTDIDCAFKADGGIIRISNNPTFEATDIGASVTNGGVIHLRTDISTLSGVITPYDMTTAYGGRIFVGNNNMEQMRGATSTTDGASGAVPKPLIADRGKFLRGDGTWVEIEVGDKAAGLIAPIEESYITSRDYSIGDQFILNEKLYTAIVMITIGDTLAPGTNCKLSNTIVKQIESSGHTIAPIEVSPSTHAYDKGDQLIYDDKLYTTTEDISVGDELVLEDTSVPKTWNGLTSFSGANIWTDGENIYYSPGGGNNKILDKVTSTWNTKTWNGLTSFSGSSIWTDGENIYYSKDSDQYVLDKDTSTWNAKTWNGFTPFSGDRIWTDGENIYYSYNSDQYVLDKVTSTWNTKTWNGLTSFIGGNIWTDGENIYYSDNSGQYVLDKDTSTWNTKTWNGLTSFYGSRIWTDGENIYYSNSSDQYIFLFNNIVLSDPIVKQIDNIDAVNLVDYEEDIYGVNLIPYPYFRPNTFESNGITFTVNADNSITAKGTATANATYGCVDRIAGPTMSVKVGERYILSGSPEGSSSSTYFIYIINTQSGEANTIARDYGDSATFILPTSESYYGVGITIMSGITVDNLTFYPMLRKATIKDNTYHPYNSQSIQNQLNEINEAFNASY